MKKKKKKSIRRTLIGLSVLPAVFGGIALTLLSVQTLWREMSNEISHSLSIASSSLYNTYSLVVPGDYAIKDGVLVKGETVIEGDYKIVDALKEAYGMELSLFFGKERKLTTIMDENGNRLVGTTADAETVHWVLENGRKYFTKNVRIGNEQYFGYYVPILNKDKTVVGMAFAGKKKSEVFEAMQNSIMKSILISVLVIVVTLCVCVASGQKIIGALKAIMDYLGTLSKSDFSHKMPKKVLTRDDEIGDMGRYAKQVSDSLKEMVTTDPLTGLYNRRACRIQLEKWQNKKKLTVVIADIDHFKRINDTYGHDCGDMVLVTVGQTLKEYFKESGCVARWGGEEFLLVFEKEEKKALDDLKEMATKIGTHEFKHKDKTFHITMTFGVNSHMSGQSLDEIISAADECLYRGKEGGRNQIVSTSGQVIEL